MDDKNKEEIIHPTTIPTEMQPLNKKPLDKVKEQTQQKRSKEREER